MLSVASGDVVTIDTMSHEGILEDQGRNPVRYLAQFGVRDVLNDAIEIAASDIVNGPDDGPHIVTGPVRVGSARPGDVLKVDILDLSMRVPYGFVSSRHGYGALVGEFPEDVDSLATRDVDSIVSMGTVSHFSWVEEEAREADRPDRGGRAAAPCSSRSTRSSGSWASPPPPTSPCTPFRPATTAATSTSSTPRSAPRCTCRCRSMAAQFYTGDPHFAQGNGEVALTALEASLRATVRLTVIDAADAQAAIGDLTHPGRRNVDPLDSDRDGRGPRRGDEEGGAERRSPSSTLGSASRVPSRWRISRRPATSRSARWSTPSRVCTA